MTKHHLTGGCHCAAIRYTIALPTTEDSNPTDHIKSLAYCHCTTCRRLSGSAFIPFLEFDASLLTLHSGGSVDIMRNDPSTKMAQGQGDAPPPPASTMTALRLSDKATRTFCAECGTPVSMVYDSSPSVIGVTAGSLDDGPAERLLTREVVGGKGTRICTGEMVGWGDLGVLGRVGRMGGCPQ